MSWLDDVSLDVETPKRVYLTGVDHISPLREKITDADGTVRIGDPAWVEVFSSDSKRAAAVRKALTEEYSAEGFVLPDGWDSKESLFAVDLAAGLMSSWNLLSPLGLPLRGDDGERLACTQENARSLFRLGQSAAWLTTQIVSPVYERARFIKAQPSA